MVEAEENYSGVSAILAGDLIAPHSSIHSSRENWYLEAVEAIG
jgi:hypothetical protein